MRGKLAFGVSRGIAVAAIAVIGVACGGGSTRQSGEASVELSAVRSDSARVAALAIAAVTGSPDILPDTLTEYRVIQFTPDSLGWLVSVIPQVRAQYADSIVGIGGGGLVRVWRGDSVTVLNYYR